MSKIALIWLAGYFGFALLAFYHPLFGLIGYFQDYYAHPPLRWWGDELPDLRWSLTIAIVTLIAYMVRRGSLPELEGKKHFQTKWLILLVLNAAVVTVHVAVWEDQSWEDTTNFVKLAILYFLITKTVRTEKHFRYLILVHIIGVLYWGWNAFDDPKRSAGRLIGIGGPDSLNDNAAAAHLLAILPFIWYVFIEGRRWEKILCMVAAPFVMNAFILANSRGAVVGLIGVGIVSLFVTKGTYRRKTFLGLLLAGSLLFSLADQQFIERQQTIDDYEADNAAIERRVSWEGALRLIRDHPFGTGGGGFEFLSPIYIPEIVEARDGERRNVHNTYLQAACEWGILGLTFFVGFLFSTICELHRLRRMPASTPEQRRLYAMSIAVELGLIGIMIAGIFGSRLQSESFYWLAAFTAIIKNLYAQEQKTATYAGDEMAREREEMESQPYALSA
jgi:probable O-glycosylation ligase (exosortase A-associated)